MPTRPDGTYRLAAFLGLAMIAACLAAACVGTENSDGDEDVGRTGAGRDDDRLRDPDTSPDDTIDRDFGEQVQEVGIADAGDAEDDGLADAPVEDAPPAAEDIAWDTPDVSNPVVVEVLQASRDAVRAWCECCNGRFGGSTSRCVTTAFEGGLAVDECRLGVYDRLGDAANEYLRCVEGAYGALASCNTACDSGNCVACQTQLALDQTACDRAHPDVVTQFEPCAG